MKVSDINNLSREEFLNVFGNIVECFPKVATELFNKVPFQNLAGLLQEAQITIDALTINEKEEILRMHPDLAGKMADAGQLTEESKNEQKAAGLTEISQDMKRQMNELNEKYKNKFGFPFVICARENKSESILNGLKLRLNNSKSDELVIGLIEVKKICKLRILDIVDNQFI